MKKKEKLKISYKELTEEFKKEIYFFMNFFSLKDFDVYFDTTDNNMVRAETIANIQNRLVTFYISPQWCKDLINKEEIRKVAFHEVLEVLFYPIREKLNAFYSFDFVDKDIHKNIVLFENIFFPLIKK